MQQIVISSLAGFRGHARALLAASVSPAAVVLEAEATAGDAQQAALFGSRAPAELGTARAGPASSPRPPALTVPATLARSLHEVAHHSFGGRWQLCYRLIWRQHHEPGEVLERRLDPDVVHFERLRAQVRRDVHRCHAFVRFSRLVDDDGEVWGAWYEPDHDVLPLAVPFFVARLGESRWWLASSRKSVAYDGRVLSGLPGRRRPTAAVSAPRAAAVAGANAGADTSDGSGVATSPADDPTGQLWRTYFAAIFNPARVNPRLMRQHMPKRFWPNLPEMQGVTTLVREATAQQESAMVSQPSPRPNVQLSLLDDDSSAVAPSAEAEAGTPAATAAAALKQKEQAWRALRDGAAACAACPWAHDATQTVFGRGPERAHIMLVGEQPGDQEDLQGAPFVGPAGQLLRDILAEVPLDPDTCYLTNAVKHFKWTPRGKRRIHQRPSARDIATCRPWLTAESQALRPRLTIALGLVAAHSLMGKAMRLGDIRGRRLTLPTCDNTWVTSHPSAILRMPEPALQVEARALMVSELKQALTSLG